MPLLGLLILLYMYVFCSLHNCYDKYVPVVSQVFPCMHDCVPVRGDLVDLCSALVTTILLLQTCGIFAVLDRATRAIIIALKVLVK